jgi:DNA-binding NarL/FixJ family response regulator
MPSTRTRPVTIALVDDYDVVLKGLAHMFDDYRDRVVVAEIDANAALSDEIDIVLYDSFAQPESDHHEIAELVRNPRARRVVVYTWNFQPELIADARRQGVQGYLSKALPARELVEALERIHQGEELFNEAPLRAASAPSLDWPGKREGITDRESEVAALTYLSPNTVKSYIRSIYRKIQVQSRTQAVIWGVGHGFSPDHHRIDHWLGGP